MPQNRSSPEPEVMTWTKAAPVLVVAGAFDAIRIFFEMFWFFGPALAALLCTVKAGAYIGTTAGSLLCGGAAAVGGAAISAFTTPFGVVMADAAGLAAFLVLGLWILMTNARLLKVNKSGMLWLSGSLGISIVPFIGAFPAFFVALWRLYGQQIKAEKAAHKKWEEEQAGQRLQYQAAELAQAGEMKAANDDAYNQAQAANDETYGAEEIPEKVRKAA